MHSIDQVRLFLVKFLFLCLIIAGIILLPFLVIPPDPSGYYQGSLTKVELLKNAASPRLIIIGGSNVVFGVDSEPLSLPSGCPSLIWECMAGWVRRLIWK